MISLEQIPVAGRIGPRKDVVDIAFWEGLAAGELRMQQCPSCQSWWWSPVWRCADCGSWDLRWRAIAPHGRVYSWIRSHQPFVPAMAAITPYVTLLVELPHAGNRRLFGILFGPEEGLKIGAPVEGVIQPASELTHHQPVMRWKLVQTEKHSGGQS